MPRNARGKVLSDGCFAHIFSRALSKRFIFCDEADFNYFKLLLKRSKPLGQYRLHHYCLMSTHFHMIVSIQNLTIFSKALKHIKQNYAKWFQRKHAHEGPVWWGRCGSRPIQDERYMYACGMYIEMNPVKAGLVRAVAEWPHSTARYYFSGKKDELVDDYEKPSRMAAAKLMNEIKLKAM